MSDAPKHSNKVLIIARSYPYWGGVETWLSQLIKGLSSSGSALSIELILLEGYTFNKPDQFAAGLGIKDYKAVRVVSGSTKSKRRLLNNEIIKSAPDLVVPVLTIDGLKSAVQIKSILGFKIILPIHEYAEGIVEELRAYGDCIDTIVSVDRLNTIFLPEKVGITAKKFIAIPGSYRAEYQNLLVRKQGNSSTKLRIGIASRWSEQKGHDAFFGAMQKRAVPTNVEFVWAGLQESEAKAIEPLRELLTKGQLVCLGQLAGNDMKRFHESIDCLLISSTWETGPLVAWDAMKAGNLLLVSDYLGMKSEGLLVDSVNCLAFEKDNPDSINSAFSKLIELHASEFGFQKIVKRAQSDVEKHRGYELFINRWKSLLIHEHSKHRTSSVLECLHYRLAASIANITELFYAYWPRFVAPSSAREEWQTHLRSEQTYKDYLLELHQFELAWVHKRDSVEKS